ncbi:phosphomannomutase/phosphoglucomutase [Pseudomonadota bacterium]
MAQKRSAEVQAELSQRIKQTLDRYIVPLETLAADSSIQNIISEPSAIEERQLQLARATGALNVTLIAAGRERSYLGEYPRLSYTELDLVHESQSGNTPGVEFHELKEGQGHIDVVRPVLRKDRLLGEITVGYILARYDSKFFREDIGKVFQPHSEVGRLELSQILSDGSTQVFMGLGNADLKGQGKSNSSVLGSTRWKLSYWQLPTQWEVLGMGWQRLYWLLTVGVLVAAALSLVVFWKVADKKMRSSVNIIYEFVWDRLNGHWLGKSYEMPLFELQETLTQIQNLDWSACQLPDDATELNSSVSSSKKIKKEEDEKEAENEFESSYVDLLYQGTADLEVKEEHATPKEKAEFTPSESVPDISTSIFRAYDIRGVVGDTLNADIAYEIGRAFGSEALNFGEQTIVVGRDGRLSSPELSEALIRGLCDVGRDVIDLGVVPTPQVYFATHYLSARSGVVITGSHNPSSYNGMKMVLQGESLTEEAIKKLYQRIALSDYTKGERGSVSGQDLLGDYTARIAGDVDMGRQLKVVLDCGNGVGGIVAIPLLRSLGCEVIELYCDVDGRFPNHHPDPCDPENLNNLIVTMQQHGADIGIALDGDGDRIGVVDSHGNIIWPDRLMMYFAQDMLSETPDGLIIYDVKSSRNLHSFIEGCGGRGMMWKTGHSLLKAKVKETGALLGGELSGHLCFNDRWFGFDDAFYAMARLLELLSKESGSTFDVFSALPEALSTPELRINLKEGEQHHFMAELAKKAQFPGAQLTTIDGIRADFAEGWGLVRASNTTPALTLRFEADSEESMERIQGIFRSAILAVSPKILLPF